jgi:hypothetical protein
MDSERERSLQNRSRERAGQAGVSFGLGLSTARADLILPGKRAILRSKSVSFSDRCGFAPASSDFRSNSGLPSVQTSHRSSSNLPAACQAAHNDHQDDEDEGDQCRPGEGLLPTLIDRH